MYRLPCVFSALLLVSAHAHHDHAHEHDDKHHHCIHDEVQAVTKGKEVIAHQEYLLDTEEERRQLADGVQRPDLRYSSSASFEPIRILLDTSHLASDSGFMCTYSGQRYNDRGTTYTCGNDDVATSAKLTFLTEELLPAAQNFLSRALRVKPVQGSLKLSSVGTQDCMYIDDVPSSHFTSGVGSYDYILYVTARPTQGATIAWAGACQWDQKWRPVAGQANFGPNKLEPTTDPAQLAIQVSTAIHEIAHALGFSSNSFDKFIDANGNTRPNVVQRFNERGHTVSKITTPKMMEKAREQFGCSTLNGVELEGSGGSGTAGSHIDKRIFHNDFMTGSSSSDPIYSAVSLALFEDSGWYRVDYAVAETLAWGKDMGCTFATGYCSSWPQSAKDAGMFCSQSGSKSCTGSLLQFKGYCSIASYSSSLPSQYQYFSDSSKGGRDQLADFCPYIAAYSNGDCRLPANGGGADYYGESYAAESRCFEHTLLRSGYVYDGERTTGCYTTRCVVDRGSTDLYVTVGGVEVKCPRNGGTVGSISGMRGELTCPPASQICVHTTSNDNVCPNNCNGRGTCSDGACICTLPYTGTSCENAPPAPTPPPEDPPADLACTALEATPCNGKGTCSAGKCDCQVGWSGEKCDTEQGSVLGAAYQAVTIEKDAWRYWRSEPISPSEKVTISVKAGSGDPDVYVSWANQQPSKSSYSDRAAAGGNGADETLTIAVGASGRPVADSRLYIGIFGYSDTTFDVKLETEGSTCVAATTCSGQGTCSSSGACICTTGYTGSDCSELDCPGVGECSGNGVCKAGSPPSCDCNSGFTGDDCNSAVGSVSSGEEISRSGGSRTISGLSSGEWKYFHYTLAAPLPSRVAISFTRQACTDSATFRDGYYKDNCASWVGYNCADGRLSTSQSNALKEACPNACQTCPGRGTMLFARFNNRPTMTGTTYSSDFFDETSWQQNDNEHNVNLINLSGSGTLWIAIFNHPSYANGDINGQLDVLPTFSRRQLSEGEVGANNNNCKQDRCHGNGECDDLKICICDEFFYGKHCESELQPIPDSNPVSGMAPGKEYAFFYYEVTDEEALTINLDVEPVGTDDPRYSVEEEGTAGTVHPRLFVRRAPSLPEANQLSFTDYFSAQANSKNHSVYVSTAAEGAGLLYIGVLDASPNAESMRFTVTVLPHRKPQRLENKCGDWTSDKCTGNHTAECADGMIADIDVEFWHYPVQGKKQFLSDRMKDSTCLDPPTLLDYELCHNYVCPQAKQCIGKTSCSMNPSECQPGYTQELTEAEEDELSAEELIARILSEHVCPIPSLGTEHKCGMRVFYTCRSMQSDNACDVANDPCGPKGSCAIQNGIAQCECSEDWIGGDCNTPPPFQTKIGDGAPITVMTKDQANVGETTEQGSSTTNSGGGDGSSTSNSEGSDGSSTTTAAGGGSNTTGGGEKISASFRDIPNAVFLCASLIFLLL